MHLLKMLGLRTTASPISARMSHEDCVLRLRIASPRVCVIVVESVVKKVTVVTVSIDVLTKVLDIVVVLWAETDVVVSVTRNSVDLPVVWKVVVENDEEVHVVDVVVVVAIVEIPVGL